MAAMRVWPRIDMRIGENKLDGGFDNCRTLEFHQVLDAEACLHSVPTLHPQKDQPFLGPKLV